MLALLLLSGTLKPFIYAYIGAVDIVLICSIMAVFDILYSKIIITKKSFNSIVLVLIFSCCIFFSIIYSNSQDYVFTKLLGYSLSVIFFVYTFCLRKFDEKIFIKTYLWVLVPLTLFFIRMKSQLWTESSSEVFMELRSNYLGIGYNLGVLIIVLSYYKKSLWLQAFCLILLFASTARGPFLFTLIVLFLMKFGGVKLLLKNIHKYIQYLFFAVIASIIIVMGFGNQLGKYFDSAIGRFENITLKDQSLASRSNMMEFAVNEPFNSVNSLLIGEGFGSFGINYFGEDIRAYPHNVLAEVFYELGLVGLIIIVLLLVLVFYEAIKNKSIFSFLLLFTILNALKSYGLADSWILFAMLGLVINTKRIFKSDY